MSSDPASQHPEGQAMLQSHAALRPAPCNRLDRHPRNPNRHHSHHHSTELPHPLHHQPPQSPKPLQPRPNHPTSLQHRPAPNQPPIKRATHRRRNPSLLPQHPLQPPSFPQPQSVPCSRAWNPPRQEILPRQPARSPWKGSDSVQGAAGSA
jgi:hypothetical protein